MQKRILCILLCCLLGISLAIPAVAAPEGPVITLQPQNYTYPEYSVAMYTVKATGSNLRTTWYLAYEGKTYNLSDNTNGIEPWEAYAGETYGASADGFSWHFGGIEEGLNGAEIWCVVEDGHYDVTSDRAIITVQGDAMPPEITDIPAEVTVKKGETADLRCIARSTDGSQLEYLWYETSTGKLQNIQAIFPEETGDFITPSTKEVGTRYYVCGISTSKGGRAYSSVVKVTVTEAAAQEELTITTKSLPKAEVGKAYETTVSCNDPKATFSLYYNPGKANDFEKTGLALASNGKITGTPTKAGSYSFTLCASGDTGEDYMTYTLVVEEAPEDTTAPTAEVTTPTEVTEGTEATTEATQPQPEKDQSGGTPLWLILLIVFGAAGIGVGATLLIVGKKK